MDLNRLAQEIRVINGKNGFRVFNEADDWGTDKVGMIIALIHSEATEMIEAYRDNDKEGVMVEAADVVIRILDFVGGFPEVDFEKVITDKVRENDRRKHLHGRKR